MVLLVSLVGSGMRAVVPSVSLCSTPVPSGHWDLMARRTSSGGFAALEAGWRRVAGVSDL